MYTGINIPEYLTQIPVIVIDNFAIVEPVSGEYIDVDSDIWTHELKTVSVLVEDTVINARTYIELLNEYDKLIKKYSNVFTGIEHHLIEQEGGMFVISIQLNFEHNGSEYKLLNLAEVPFDTEVFNSLYSDEEVPVVDDYAIMSAAITQSLTLIARNANILSVDCKTVMSNLVDNHTAISGPRWEYVERELRHGIASIYVIRRWGIIDTFGILPNGKHEFERFLEIYNRINEESKYAQSPE